MDRADIVSDFLTVEQFQRQVVPWSEDTIYRRIKDGMPAIKVGRDWLFDRKLVGEWIKRFTVRAG